MRRAVDFAAIAASLALLTAAGPGAAAVPLRSGEHRTFSRLVFADASDRSWQISRPAADRVVIAFSAGAPDLDVRAVFDLIPRDRIADVETKGRELSLTLNCDCPVEVFQIPSGHVVIDVRDGNPSASSIPAGTGRTTRTSPPSIRTASPTAILPTVFPLRALAYRPQPEPGVAINGKGVEREDIVPPGPRQVRLHPSGVVPLLRTLETDAVEPSDASSCPIEPVARDALLSDPAAAMASLPDRRGELLDGEDRLDVAAIRKLALAYLAAGWGAEAAGAAASIPFDDGIVGIVAAAIDGGDVADGVVLDPGCGPATATVALLVRSATRLWDRNDPAELRRFLDRLDPVTWALLRPRLQERLARLDDGDLLAGLGTDPTSDPGPVHPPEALAAGTDEAAVGAAIRILQQANALGEPSAERHLVNAMALLPSIPTGDLRHGLEQELAASFVLSRRPLEAVRMVADGTASAESMLTLALDRIPAAENAELAVRLQPYLPDGSMAASRAAEMFAGFGLTATARTFADDGGRLPVEARAEGPLADPWMTRNLQAMSDADPATWTARNRLASEIIDRNATPRPATDLAAAGATLERSRVVSDLVAGLLAADGPQVTPR